MTASAVTAAGVGHSPWQRRVGTGPARSALVAAVREWAPGDGLRLDRETVEERITDAARTGAADRDLLHPSTAAVLAPRGRRPVARDVQLVAWLAGRFPRPGDEARFLDVEHPVHLWSASGYRRLVPGRHAFADLARHTGARSEWSLALDPWCRAAQVPLDEAWDVDLALPVEDGTAQRVARDARLFLRALALARSVLPACLEWVASAVSVAVPLAATGEAAWRSGSVPELPGLVWLDVRDAGQVLEGLVHEAAHHELFRAEAAGPLIEPGYEGSYWSPLRRTHRPLRGVLLAHHALAHIAAYYRDALAAGLPVEQPYEATLATLAEAEAGVEAGRAHLTGRGSRFLRDLDDTAEYARAR